MSTRKTPKKPNIRPHKTSDRSADDHLVRALECLRRASGIGRRTI